MRLLIGIVWAICLFMVVVAIAGRGLAVIAGATGWLALAVTFSVVGEEHRRKSSLKRAYNGILAMARDGRCVNEMPDFECVNCSFQECGACWAMVFGFDPEDWKTWYEGRPEHDGHK